MQRLIRTLASAAPPMTRRFQHRQPGGCYPGVAAGQSALHLAFGSDRDAGLLVVGIGIMNIMPVSVTERAREIGIRLAVGATEADVQFQLLSESVAISLLAHVSGVIAGRSLVAFPNHSAIGN
jgi:hypothetical protein